VSGFEAKLGASGGGEGMVTPENRGEKRLGGHGMACAFGFCMNAALDFLAEALDKAFSYVAPSVSFGLYMSAEALFLYGLYLVFFGSHHGPP